MKKLLLLLAVVATLALSACTQNQQAPATDNSQMGESETEAPEISSPSSEAEAEAPDDVDGEEDTPSAQVIDQAERQAIALTEHLVNRVFHEGIVDRGEAVTDREIFDFFTTLPGFMDNRDHPYADAVERTPDYLYIFPEEKVRQAPYELFGVENWAFDDMIEYNAETGQYESGLEFGTGKNNYLCSELQAAYLEESGVIEVTFQLEGAAVVDGDPGWQDLGQYAVRYQLMEENGYFLRFESIRKA